MSAEETLILNFLKGSPGESHSRREIARKAVRRRVYEEHPNWLDAPLAGLLNRGLIERDDSGGFRCKKDAAFS